MTRSAFARRCLSKRYLQELFTFSHSPKFFYSPLYTQKRNTVNCRVLACSKRSDSAERCEVKKAMKSRGGLGREVRSLSHLSSSLAFIFSRSFLLRTAPHYLNAWNWLVAYRP